MPPPPPQSTREPAGIYIHWPFCARKCPYCDFYTFGREHPDFNLSGQYLDSLLAEIGAAREALSAEQRRIDTIYFGGGTPSLMTPDELGAILAAVRAAFVIADGAEITMEVNPTAAEADRMAEARNLGVNRVSFGVQSFNDAHLKTLGRDHNADEARRALRFARSLGFENFSLDLMFGLPGQTRADLEADVEEALEFAPAHISAYGLTLHEGTPFKRWHAEGRLKLPEGEPEAGEFEHLMDRLAEAGYVQYEISNWSRPGRESRHNSKYWRACDVHAFGAGAHGVLSGRRYAHPRDLRGYIAAAETGAWTEQEPAAADAREAAGEIMMLALRRTTGVAWSEIDAWLAAWIADWSEPARESFASEIEKLLRDGLIEDRPDQLKLTRRGILFADSAAEAFF